jgi:hypothetical protein
MFRALTVITAVAALAVSAAPVASAHTRLEWPVTDYAVTPSGGETLGNDWVKAPTKPGALTGGIPDGTSNTMGIIAILIG